MKKSVFLFAWVFLVGLVTLSSYGNAAGLKYTNNQVSAIPSFNVGISQNGTQKGEYQITAPKELQAGKKGTIKLVIIPESMPTEKLKRFRDFDEVTTQSFGGSIELFRTIVAKIEIVGIPYSVIPQSVELIVDPNNVTSWEWSIRTSALGTQKALFTLALPETDDKVENRLLVHTEFQISIYAPNLTATPTLPPVPSATPMHVEGTAGIPSQIFVNAIGGILATTFLALIALAYNKTFSLVKKRQGENEAKQRLKAGGETKKNLPNNQTITKYIAFLRAINVGEHTVKMDTLRQLFESLGFSNVETFIASGNVIFETKVVNTKTLEKRIEICLKESLGYEVAAFIRSDAELAEIAAYKPFPQSQLDAAAALNIGFLANPLDDAAVQKLMSLRTDIDDFHVHGREVYWLCKKKQSESKVSNVAIEKALGIKTTLRGVSTVRKLAEKYC
jgi:uncharacterized protein (DUF1697 family)